MKLAVNVGWNTCLFLFSFMTGVGDKWAECKGGGGTQPGECGSEEEQGATGMIKKDTKFFQFSSIIL